ncbi:hypothetical protein SEA_ARACELI_79 [Streptomyces phage Araceli]|nr:hypothetical protein SEA_HENOCCUS_80 [Streptomyces phage Henoccus]QFG07893.1 hypothetical protein SEA_ARACELI_79 [Streptomyces phage Araceli]
MDANTILLNCTCGRQNETSPAMHGGTCVVWSLNHNLGAKPVEVLHTFETCIHVGLWHPTLNLESPIVNKRIKIAAKAWAKANGYTLGSKVSEGWTLGEDESQTRHIFTVRKES